MNNADWDDQAADDWDEFDPEGPSRADVLRFDSDEHTCHACGADVYQDLDTCPACGSEVVLETKRARRRRARRHARWTWLKAVVRALRLDRVIRHEP